MVLWLGLAVIAVGAGAAVYFLVMKKGVKLPLSKKPGLPERAQEPEPPMVPPVSPEPPSVSEPPSMSPGV